MDMDTDQSQTKSSVIIGLNNNIKSSLDEEEKVDLAADLSLSSADSSDEDEEERGVNTATAGCLPPASASAVITLGGGGGDSAATDCDGQPAAADDNATITVHVGELETATTVAGGGLKSAGEAITVEPEPIALNLNGIPNLSATGITDLSALGTTDLSTTFNSTLDESTTSETGQQDSSLDGGVPPPPKIAKFELDRDLIPDRISTFIREKDPSDNLMFVLKFKDSDKEFLMPSPDAHKEYPHLVAKFYDDLTIRHMPF